MKIAFVVGTRPEVIKMAPVIKECEKRSLDFILIHSNQHYSKNMDSIFFEELNLPKPNYNLNVGSGSHSNQTGNILIKIEPILIHEKPDFLLVQGDTNTVLAAALAGEKLGIKVVHIEAGLRSYDRTMPEETNRVTTDHLSSILFAVTDVQANILVGEGIKKDKIFVVGNTIADALLQNKKFAEKKIILKKLGLVPRNYCLFTAHRAANVDTEEALRETLDLLKVVPFTVVWPMHVRTRKRILEYKLSVPSNIKITEPLGYLDFLKLEQSAKMIITDSGGLQEEACILGIPCITIRENTERPETVKVGANILIGRSKEKLIKALKHTYPKKWKNPFGGGMTAKAIIGVIAPSLNKSPKKEIITVVGLGYMGLPTSLLLAKAGYCVRGFDIDNNKVKKINSGECFDEPGLPLLLKEGLDSKRFTASSEITPSDVYILSVPTPCKNNKCDLKHVEAAVSSVANVAKDGDLIILESTVKPRTCSDYVASVFKKNRLNVDIAYCPERAFPGNTLNEIVYNDRVVGGMTSRAALRAKNIYSSFVKGEITSTTAITAEVVKLMENTYRDVNIALANEFSILADELGFNVFEAISLANRHPRVKILQPGPGVGGHCIAIDPWFLAEDTKSAKLITTARNINDSMPSVVVRRLYRSVGEKQKLKIGILGLAYKKNVDDARETPAKHIIDLLEKDGHQVRVHDPFVKEWYKEIEHDLSALKKWADAFILVTDHDEYKDFKTPKPLLDTRFFYQHKSNHNS